MNLKIALLTVIFAGFCCLSNFAAPEAAKDALPFKISDTVTATEKKLSKSIAPPNTSKKEVLPAEIEIQFPEFSGAAGDATIAALNAAIQARVLSLVEGEPAKSLEELVQRFSKEYQDSVIENPEMPGGWSLKYKVDIEYVDTDMLSLKTFVSTFTGGAHPNSEITLQVFSLKTGKPFAQGDFITSDKREEFTAIAEKHFRRVRELKPDETYEQAGFHFENNKFALNDNFLVTQDGMLFCFNQYEIAPYAMGMTEVNIPWSDLKTVIAANSPASRFLK